MAKAIRVLIADDHPVVRAGLGQILKAESDITIVGEAKNGLEAINKTVELTPDVILMDIYMPQCSGLEAMIKIKERQPNAKIIVLTISECEDDLFQALRFGDQGYLSKGGEINEVLAAVRMAAAGEAVLSANMITRLVAEFRNTNVEPKLSSRELEVLQLLGEGLTNTEIGSRLFISESTVRTYLHRLLNKLHLRNRAEAASYAAQHHMIGRRF
jgi:DNA-binding NarL/FixJ family response regulator